MILGDRVVLITGGAHGIGRALARRIAAEHPRMLAILDRDLDAARETAEDVNGLAIACDVTSEPAVAAAVAQVLEACGRIDLVLSNAGVTTKGGFEVPDAQWQHLWNVNVMAHVYLARAVVPGMVEQGGGAFVVTASAAGLLTEIGSAAYSVTKHGAVAFAEWLSIHYRNRGLQVACVCPAGVATDFLDLTDPVHQFLNASSVTPEVVAECVLETLAREKFLVLPQEIVGEMFQFKSHDYDRWLQQFGKLNQRLQRQAARKGSPATATPSE